MVSIMDTRESTPPHMELSKSDCDIEGQHFEEEQRL